MTKRASSAQRVQQALDQANLTTKVVELPDSTRTAREAALAVGCQVGQIVKSLIFQTQGSHRPVLIMTSGINQVDEKIAGETIGEKIKLADPDYVRETTGFAIGGVSPVGHTQDLSIYVDRDLLSYDVIWAAAGTPHAVFRITPQDLVVLTEGTIIKVC